MRSALLLLVLLPLLAACGGSEAELASQLSKVVPVQTGMPALVVVYTDG